MTKEFNFDYHHLNGLLDFDEEEEDALSLCDLAMDGNNNNNEYSKGEGVGGGSNFDHQQQHQDFFEFCSGDLSCSSSDGVIFCGKLISEKDEQLIHQNSYKSSNQFNKSRSISEPRQVKRPYNKTWSMSFSTDKNHGKLNNNKLNFYHVKKVSIIATHVKSSSKWPFGVGRSPVEMEYRDINKRNTFRSNDDKKKESERRSGMVFCGLLDVLMLKKRHTTNQFQS